MEVLGYLVSLTKTNIRYLFKIKQNLFEQVFEPVQSKE